MLDSPGACSHLFRRVQDAGRECEAGNFGRKDWERGGRDLVHCIQQIGQMLLAEQQEMQKEGKKAAARDRERDQHQQTTPSFYSTSVEPVWHQIIQTTHILLMCALPKSMLMTFLHSNYFLNGICSVDLTHCSQDADVQTFAKLLTEEDAGFFQLFFDDQGTITSKAARFPVFSQAIALMHCPTNQVNAKAKNAVLYVLSLLSNLDDQDVFKLPPQPQAGASSSGAAGGAAATAVSASPATMSGGGGLLGTMGPGNIRTATQAVNMTSWFRRECCALFTDSCVALRGCLLGVFEQLGSPASILGGGGPGPGPTPAPSTTAPSTLHSVRKQWRLWSDQLGFLVDMSEAIPRQLASEAFVEIFTTFVLRSVLLRGLLFVCVGAPATARVEGDEQSLCLQSWCHSHFALAVPPLPRKVKASSAGVGAGVASSARSLDGIASLLHKPASKKLNSDGYVAVSQDLHFSLLLLTDIVVALSGSSSPSSTSTPSLTSKSKSVVSVRSKVLTEIGHYLFPLVQHGSSRAEDLEFLKHSLDRSQKVKPFLAPAGARPGTSTTAASSVLHSNVTTRTNSPAPRVPRSLDDVFTTGLTPPPPAASPLQYSGGPGASPLQYHGASWPSSQSLVPGTPGRSSSAGGGAGTSDLLSVDFEKGTATIHDDFFVARPSPLETVERQTRWSVVRADHNKATTTSGPSKAVSSPRRVVRELAVELVDAAGVVTASGTLQNVTTTPLQFKMAKSGTSYLTNYLPQQLALMRSNFDQIVLGGAEAAVATHNKAGAKINHSSRRRIAGGAVVGDEAPSSRSQQSLPKVPSTNSSIDKSSAGGGGKAPSSDQLENSSSREVSSRGGSRPNSSTSLKGSQPPPGWNYPTAEEAVAAEGGTVAVAAGVAVVGTSEGAPVVSHVEQQAHQDPDRDPASGSGGGKLGLSPSPDRLPSSAMKYKAELGGPGGGGFGQRLRLDHDLLLALGCLLLQAFAEEGHFHATSRAEKQVQFWISLLRSRLLFAARHATAHLLAPLRTLCVAVKRETELEEPTMLSTENKYNIAPCRGIIDDVILFNIAPTSTPTPTTTTWGLEEGQDSSCRLRLRAITVDIVLETLTVLETVLAKLVRADEEEVEEDEGERKHPPTRTAEERQQGLSPELLVRILEPLHEQLTAPLEFLQQLLAEDPATFERLAATVTGTATGEVEENENEDDPDHPKDDNRPERHGEVERERHTESNGRRSTSSALSIYFTVGTLLHQFLASVQAGYEDAKAQATPLEPFRDVRDIYFACVVAERQRKADQHQGGTSNFPASSSRVRAGSAATTTSLTSLGLSLPPSRNSLQTPSSSMADATQQVRDGFSGRYVSAAYVFFRVGQYAAQNSGKTIFESANAAAVRSWLSAVFDVEEEETPNSALRNQYLHKMKRRPQVPRVYNYSTTTAGGGAASVSSKTGLQRAAPGPAGVTTFAPPGPRTPRSDYHEGLKTPASGAPSTPTSKKFAFAPHSALSPPKGAGAPPPIQTTPAGLLPSPTMARAGPTSTSSAVVEGVSFPLLPDKSRTMLADFVTSSSSRGVPEQLQVEGDGAACARLEFCEQLLEAYQNTLKEGGEEGGHRYHDEEALSPLDLMFDSMRAGGSTTGGMKKERDDPLSRSFLLFEDSQFVVAVPDVQVPFRGLPVFAESLLALEVVVQPSLIVNTVAELGQFVTQDPASVLLLSLGLEEGPGVVNGARGAVDRGGSPPSRDENDHRKNYSPRDAGLPDKLVALRNIEDLDDATLDAFLADAAADDADEARQLMAEFGLDADDAFDEHGNIKRIQVPAKFSLLFGAEDEQGFGESGRGDCQEQGPTSSKETGNSASAQRAGEKDLKEVVADESSDVEKASFDDGERHMPQRMAWLLA
eukprot:g5956.t1